MHVCGGECGKWGEWGEGRTGQTDKEFGGLDGDDAGVDTEIAQDEDDATDLVDVDLVLGYLLASESETASKTEGERA